MLLLLNKSLLTLLALKIYFMSIILLSFTSLDAFSTYPFQVTIQMSSEIYIVEQGQKSVFTEFMTKVNTIYITCSTGIHNPGFR